MTDEKKGPETHAEDQGDGASDGEKKSTRDRVESGIREGIGVLSAMKDAIEETIQEARERGDLSAEKAKEVVKDALEKAQLAGERAREKLDFKGDLEGVKGALDTLRQRVIDLEVSVFGASREPEPTSEADGGEAGEGASEDGGGDGEEDKAD